MCKKRVNLRQCAFIRADGCRRIYVKAASTCLVDRSGISKFEKKIKRYMCYLPNEQLYQFYHYFSPKSEKKHQRCMSMSFNASHPLVRFVLIISLTKINRRCSCVQKRALSPTPTLFSPFGSGELKRGKSRGE
uniref:Uncharacterized protein n=1 Tax=Romanomermis culicivorax TaxID=13658 RepID=A0A915JDJ4_ROMCU